MKLSIIIPTLNERGSLPILFAELDPVCRKLQTNGYEVEVAIIDDQSTDGTIEYVKEKQAEADYKIKLLSRQEKGLATAVIYGFDNTDGELICVMDADLSHPPGLIPTLTENAKAFDLVLPCRNMPEGGAEEWPWHRKTTSQLATYLVHFINIKARDPLSGFFLLHRSVIKDVKLSPIGYKILLEILVKGKYKNYIEVPYIFRNRAVGSSKMGLKIIWQYLRHLWLLKKWQKENKLSA